MNFFYHLSLQAFNPLAFKERENLYWTIELSFIVFELMLMLFLPFDSLISLSAFTLRLFIIKSSLFTFISRCFYLGFFLLKFRTDLPNLISLFKKKNIKATNFNELILELEEELFTDLLTSHLHEDNLLYYFYQHKLKSKFRNYLFISLEKKVISSESVSPESFLFKNLLTLLKAFKKVNPVLTSKERAILTCIGIKLEHQVSVSFIEAFNPNQFSAITALMTALKDCRIAWHHFPNLGLKSNPCAEKLMQDPYPWGTLSVTEKRLRQLISLVLYFNDTNTLEESYIKLYKNKKRMRLYWADFLESKPTDLEVIAWLNLNILVTMWNLNYDELLKIYKNEKIPKHFYVSLRKPSEISALAEFGTYLKENYTSKRILAMILKDGGTNEFNESIKAFASFKNSPFTVEAPAKPKSFRELNIFFQINGTYREECLETLPQNNLEHLYGILFENYILKIPKTRKELLLTGQKLSICVGSSSIYTLRVQQKESYIIFMCQEDEPKYCLELCQRTLDIKQAKGSHNHQLDTDTMFRVRDFLRGKITLDKNKENLIIT